VRQERRGAAVTSAVLWSIAAPMVASGGCAASPRFALLILALLPSAAFARSVPANFFGVMANGPLDSPSTDLMAETPS